MRHTPELAELAAKRTATGQWCSASGFHLQRQLHDLLFVELGARVLQLGAHIEQQLYLTHAGSLPCRGQLSLDGRELRDDALMRCLQPGALVCGVGRLRRASHRSCMVVS